MAGLIINHQRCTLCLACVQGCPFQALSVEQGKIEVGAGCKMCRICVGSCPSGAIRVEQSNAAQINKKEYQNILVYIEHDGQRIHPVSFELIGKALELVQVTHQKVNALMIGCNIQALAETLLYTGVDQVYLYEAAGLEHFRVDSYTRLFEDCINQTKPSVCLVGATTTGRSLAPRVATRFKTGLTADCTELKMRKNTDLVQIRPAFGGNIMAQIINTNHRPQFATVRYKVMNAAPFLNHKQGKLVLCKVEEEQLKSAIEILSIEKKTEEKSITEADVLVVAGAGIKDEKGMAMVQQLAAVLQGMVAVSRPMVEKGMGSVHQQIGLSGRTVKPKLIITCGVSGAIQFTAGMDGSETIIAINKDAEAPIFKLAHVAVVDDVYEFLPRLLAHIEEGYHGL